MKKRLMPHSRPQQMIDHETCEEGGNKKGNSILDHVHGASNLVEKPLDARTLGDRRECQRKPCKTAGEEEAQLRIQGEAFDTPEKILLLRQRKE